MSSSSGSYDTKRFPLCEPWHGQRGKAFKERFMPNFLAACMGKHDDYCTWEQHLQGEVPGGILPTSPQQLAANPQHVNAARPHQGNAGDMRKSEAAFRNRESSILSAFRQHIPVEAVQLRIDHLVQLHRANDFQGGAPVTNVAIVVLQGQAQNVVPAHPVYAAGHPQAAQPLSAYDLAAYQACGNSLTRHIIRIIGLEAMPDPTSGLTQLDAENRWANLKMSDVGITPTTPRDLAAHISRLAVEVGANEQGKVIKFLSLFTSPPEIATKATAELARCSEHLRRPDGSPDYLKLTREMQEFWEVSVSRAKIQFKAPPSNSSNSLSAFKLSVDDEDDLESYVLSGYSLAAAGAKGSSVANEALCWNCLGFGHTKNDSAGQNQCPSERRFRKISDAVAVLSSKAVALNRGQPRGRGGGSANRGRGRGRGGPPPGSHKPPPAANLLDAPPSNQASVDEDGNVFSVDGTHLGSIAETEDKSKSASSEPAEDLTADEFEDVDAARFDMGDFGSTSLGGNVFSLSLDGPGPLCLECAGDADVSGIVADESARTDERSSDTPTELEVERKSSPLSCLANVLMCIATAASGLATSLNGNRRVLTTGAVCLATGVGGTSVSIDSFAMSTAFAAVGTSNVVWDAHIDSGTSVTASGRCSLFPPKLIKKWHPKFSVRSASQQIMPVEFVGTMVLKPADMPKKKKRGVMVKDALYVPAMKSLTLVSPCQLFRSQGIKTYFNDENCLVLPDGSSINFSESNRSYVLRIEPLDSTMMSYGDDDVAKFMSAEDVEQCFKLSSDTAITAELIHRRCCHFSPDRINASLSLVTGLCHVPRSFCHDCLRGGMKAPSVQPPRKKSDADRVAKPKSKEFGDLIWADTCSLPVSEPHGYIGWIAFLDDATRCLDLYFVRNHSSEEFTKCMQSFLTDNAEYLPKVDGKPRIKCLGTDNGTEFFSADADKFLAELFTRHVAMPSFSPWRNPSERSHGIILRCIRVVHAESGAELKFWPFTAKQAVFVHNGLVTRSERVKHPGTSPYFMKTGKNADFTRLKCLFCNMTCFVRDKKESLSKIDIPTVEGIHLGIDHVRGGYYVFVPSWKRFSTFGFNECRAFENDPYPNFGTEFSGGNDGINPPVNGPALTDRAGNRTRGTGRRARHAAAAPAAAAMPATTDVAPAVVAAAPAVAAAAPAVAADANFVVNETDALFVSVNDAYSMILDKIGPEVFLCLNLDAIGGLPTPPRKAAEFNSRPDGAEWWAGAQIEYDAKMANQTFTLVERPKDGTNVIKTRIVCTYKFDPITGALRDNNGHYVRWVAKGYSEVFGRDYFETYTATTKACGLRMFGAIVAAYDLDTCHIDDVKFFTQTPLPAPLYCEQMDGFVEGGYLPDGRSKLVCRLSKGLEGLKQSGNNAQVQCTAHLTGPCKLTQLVSEPTIFTRTFMLNGEMVFFILLVWIDDKWAAFSRGGYESIVVPFLKVYNQRFKCTVSTGDVQRFIGLDITRNRAERTLSFSQEKYIAEFVPKFVDDLKAKVKKNMMPATATKPDPYHALYDTSLTVTEGDRVDKPYLAAVASAMYAACMTRGDYAYYVSFLSQFSKLPFLKAWEALEQVLVSLYATRKQKLTYGGKVIKIPDAPTCSPPLNPSVIQKMFGLVVYSDASWKLGCTYAGFFILFCNAAVDWGSLKLKVMLSSTEGEIAAGSHATRRVVYVRHLLGEILRLPKLPVTHIVDNSATPPLTEKMGASRKTEHFRRWQQFMRYAVVHGHSYVHLCATRDQFADGLTKVTNATQYLNMRATMLNL